MNGEIAVLFCMKDSIYKEKGCDCFDISRNALTFKGNKVIIAHPPCRLWGRLKHFSKAHESEKALALFAIKSIRENGGILEHPLTSNLWDEIKIERDGGFFFDLKQFWFGHKAEKKTRLWIKGIELKDIPPIELRMGYPEYVIAPSKKNLNKKKHVTKKERNATPEGFADWLIEIALKIKRKLDGDFE